MRRQVAGRRNPQTFEDRDEDAQEFKIAVPDDGHGLSSLLKRL